MSPADSSPPSSRVARRGAPSWPRRSSLRASRATASSSPCARLHARRRSRPTRSRARHTTHLPARPRRPRLPPPPRPPTRRTRRCRVARPRHHTPRGRALLPPRPSHLSHLSHLTHLSRLSPPSRRAWAHPRPQRPVQSRPSPTRLRLRRCRRRPRPGRRQSPTPPRRQSHPPEAARRGRRTAAARIQGPGVTSAPAVTVAPVRPATRSR